MLIWLDRIRLLVIACICVVLASCGGKSDQAGAADEDPQSPETTSPFHSMRPGPEDRMALPRLGFTWEFDPAAASLQGAEVEEVRYIVHVACPSGAPHDTAGTWQSEAVINLHPDFRPGECAWWVEAILPDGAVIRSPRSSFMIVE